MSPVLYATWDGPNQNYLSTLFLPIFSALRRHDYRISVMQLTWAGRELTDSEAAAAARLEVPYSFQHVPPWFRKGGLPVVVAAGGLGLSQLAHRMGARLLLARSIIPAAMALVALRSNPALRLVFDADGLMADERIDFSGMNPLSSRYNFLRHVESKALRVAAAVITRTEKSKSILVARAGAGFDEKKIFVVPNGKDPEQFKPREAAHTLRIRREWGVSDTAPWLVYAGSLGAQYHPDEMLRFFALVREHQPAATLHWFTLSDKAARELVMRHSLPNVHVVPLSPERIADLLPAADLGIAFRATSFSQQAVCPIKVAEYLLSGLPVVSTLVGDLDRQLSGCAGAFLLPDLAEASLRRAAAWLVEYVLPNRQHCRTACRATGLEWFSLDRCTAGYRATLQHADA